MKEPKSPHDLSKDQGARHPRNIPTSVVKTCRDEIDDIKLSVQAFTVGSQSELIALPVSAHKLPPDLAGYYFIAAALEQKKTQDINGANPNDPDHVSARTQVINGDGMLYRVHFAGGQAALKSRIAKTPCYYADQITQQPSKYPKAYRFRDAGPSRSSSKLGNRNQLNTAFLQTRSRFIVTFDAGIPWILDPDSMELIEPVGTIDKWLSLTDPFGDITPALNDALKNVAFPPHANPAHPVCDRYKPENSFLEDNHCPVMFTSDHLLTLNYSVGYKGKFRNTFDRFLRRLSQKRANRNNSKQGIATTETRDGKTQQAYKPRIYGFTDLLRYSFYNRTLERWQLVLPDWDVKDPDVEKLVIGEQSIHQMVVTEDYIILADIAFKIEFSQIFSSARAPEEWLDKVLEVLTWLVDRLPKGKKSREWLQQQLLIIRLRVGYWLYSKLLQLIPPSQITNFYIVNRSALKSVDHSTKLPEHIQSVPVRKLTIPREVSHFTADYSNPCGKITLHIGHNNGTDVTEWISKYDQPVEGKQDECSEKDFQRLAGMLTGAMDIGSFGRYVIDGKTGALLDSKVISDVEHTWWPSVYTHRDICRDRPSEYKTKTIKTMFWICNGFSWEIVPDRLFQIYKDRDFRVIHHTGVDTSKPCKLLRLDTETMKIVDWFDFPVGHFACSPQFIPKSSPCPKGQDLSTHGYIACVVLADQSNEKAGTGNADPDDEFWVFDAANLGNQGESEQPATVYKLSRTLCPGPLNLGLTIHSIWLSEDDFSTGSQPYLDPNERCNLRIDAFWRDYGVLVACAGDRYSRLDKFREIKKVDKTTKILFRKVQKLFVEQTLEKFIPRSEQHD